MTLPEWIAYYNQKNPQDPFMRNEMFDLFFGRRIGMIKPPVQLGVEKKFL